MREIKAGFARYYNRRPDKMQAKVIGDKVVAKERKNEFEISRIQVFEKDFYLSFLISR
jgi:hypothetical protein